MASNKLLWLGATDKLLLKKNDRSTAASLDGSATALSGALIPIELHTTATVAPGLIAASSTADTSVTITGAAVGDFVQLTPPTTLAAGITWNAFVSAANTVKVRLANVTVAGITPASATWSFNITKA